MRHEVDAGRVSTGAEKPYRSLMRLSTVPRPAGFVVKKGSNTRLRRSWLLPTPLSVTSIAT
jgi:hypothetical protein